MNKVIDAFRSNNKRYVPDTMEGLLELEREFSQSLEVRSYNGRLLFETVKKYIRKKRKSILKVVPSNRVLRIVR